MGVCPFTSVTAIHEEKCEIVTCVRKIFGKRETTSHTKLVSISASSPFVSFRLSSQKIIALEKYIWSSTRLICLLSFSERKMVTHRESTNLFKFLADFLLYTEPSYIPFIRLYPRILPRWISCLIRQYYGSRVGTLLVARISSVP